MRISRKEFFKKGLFSLGEAVLSVTGSLKPPAVSDLPAQEEKNFLPENRADQVAVSFNEHCLAGSCGCFDCIERCEARAVHLVIGKGIRIDEEACTGCGTCEYICPGTPKGVRLAARETRNISDAAE